MRLLRQIHQRNTAHCNLVAETPNGLILYPSCAIENPQEIPNLYQMTVPRSAHGPKAMPHNFVRIQFFDLPMPEIPTYPSQHQDGIYEVYGHFCGMEGLIDVDTGALYTISLSSVYAFLQAVQTRPIETRNHLPCTRFVVKVGRQGRLVLADEAEANVPVAPVRTPKGKEARSRREEENATLLLD